MAWAVWLAVPVLATSLAAVWAWLRSRPAHRPDTAESMQAHSDYLDALVQTVHTGPTPRPTLAEHERSTSEGDLDRPG